MFDASEVTAFRQHCDKRRTCRNLAIYSFAIVFSSIFDVCIPSCLTLSYLYTYFDAIAQTTFENIMAKGEFFHDKQFPLCDNDFTFFFKVLVTMFSKSSATDLLYVGKGQKQYQNNRTKTNESYYYKYLN